MMFLIIVQNFCGKVSEKKKEKRIFAPFKLLIGMKYDVFISYSRKDMVIADQICAAFDKAGISYFIDRQGIGGGMEFPKVLAPAIRESEIFLLLASQNAYDSAYTDREITFAFNKKRGEKMLPYIIDETPLPEHLELIFSSNNWLLLKVHPIETRLVDDILQLLGRPKMHKAETNIPRPFSHETNTSDTDTKKAMLHSKKKHGKWGFIDKAGNIIIPFEYDDAWEFSQNLAAVKKKGKWGFIDKAGNTIIPFEYDRAVRFSEGLAGVIKNGKCGFIDKAGNIVVPFNFDDAWHFDKGFAKVKKNGRSGLIDKVGNTIIPCEYDDIRTSNISDGFIAVQKNGRWGCVDKKGNVTIQFKYANAPIFHDGKALVTTASNFAEFFGFAEYFSINEKGEKIN